MRKHDQLTEWFSQLPYNLGKVDIWGSYLGVRHFGKGFSRWIAAWEKIP